MGNANIIPVVERLCNPTLTVKLFGNAAGSWLAVALAASTATCVFLRDQATGPLPARLFYR